MSVAGVAGVAGGVAAGADVGAGVGGVTGAGAGVGAVTGAGAAVRLADDDRAEPGDRINDAVVQVAAEARAEGSYVGVGVFDGAEAVGGEEPTVGRFEK